MTLGNEPPDAITIITDCVSQFDPTLKTKATLEMARADLTTLLHDKSVLVVIDDVWPGKSAEVAKALMVPSPNSRFLLTTRFPQIAADPDIKAEDFPLDEMSFEQAAELIGRAFARELSQDERDLAGRLCEIVGGHPMALELAAARIKEGRQWKALLDDLAAEISRLETLEEDDGNLIAEPIGGETRRRRTSVRASLLLSVRYLSGPGQQLFAWLGVVAEEATISPAMAATLWSLEEDTADKQLRALCGLGILSVKVGGYGIHDLMHDLARELLNAPETVTGAGEVFEIRRDFRGAVEQFLERYRAKTRNNLWHTLPDDGYIHDHLIYHFEQAGWDSEVEVLLSEESADGHCGWYQVRERLGHTAGFIGDVGRIWSYADRLANAATSEASRSKAIALQLHCALIITSINSLSAGIPVEVLVGSVRCGALAIPSALALARQNPEPRLRVEALLALHAVLQWSRWPNVLIEALSAARGIEDARSRAETLAEVAQRLPADDQPCAFNEALSAARAVDDPRSRGEALAGVAQQLPPEAALEVARGIDVAYSRARALAEVALRLPAEEALAVALAIDNVRFRGEALAGIAKQLPAEKARAVARGIGDTYWRARSLAEVAQRLPAEDQLGLLGEALNDAMRVGVALRARALAEVAQRLPAEERSRLLGKALVAARGIDNARSRAETLAEVALRLPVEEALEVARSVDAWSRVRALANVIQRLSVEEALAVARGIDDAHWRARALAEIAQRLPAEEQHNVLGEALEAVRRIGDAPWRGRALERVAESLWSEEQPGAVRRALSAARAIAIALFRTGALPVLEPRLTTEDQFGALDDALIAARGIGDAELRAWTLGDIAQRLPTEDRREVLGEALNAARVIEDGRSRALALAEVAQRLPREQRAEVLSEALSAARYIEDAELRAWTLASVAQRLDGIQISRHLIHQWVETTRVLATHKRSESVSDFAAILPFIRGLGGENAVLSLGHSISRVGKWWP